MLLINHNFERDPFRNFVAYFTGDSLSLGHLHSGIPLFRFISLPGLTRPEAAHVAEMMLGLEVPDPAAIPIREWSPSAEELPEWLLVHSDDRGGAKRHDFVLKTRDPVALFPFRLDHGIVSSPMFDEPALSQEEVKELLPIATAEAESCLRRMRADMLTQGFR